DDGTAGAGATARAAAQRVIAEKRREDDLRSLPDTVMVRFDRRDAFRDEQTFRRLCERLPASFVAGLEPVPALLGIAAPRARRRERGRRPASPPGSRPVAQARPPAGANDDRQGRPSTWARRRQRGRRHTGPSRESPPSLRTDRRPGLTTTDKDDPERGHGGPPAGATRPARP